MRQNDEETLEKLPRSVQIVVGDLGDPATAKAAVEGCNKIVFCAAARSTITGDLTRVDHQGVYNLSKAFQVCAFRSYCEFDFTKRHVLAFIVFSSCCDPRISP